MHHTKFTTSTKYPHIKTVYVCKTANRHETKHPPIRHANTRTRKNSTTTTRHSNHKSVEPQATGRKNGGRKHTSTKKTSTRKIAAKKTIKKNTTKKTTTKNTPTTRKTATRKITTRKTTSRKTTTRKTTTRKTSTINTTTKITTNEKTTAEKAIIENTTKISTANMPTPTSKASITSTTEIALALPTATNTNSDVSDSATNESPTESPNSPTESPTSPTESPTSPTESPTDSLTDSSTESPTDSLTGSSTESPTDSIIAASVPTETPKESSPSAIPVAAPASTPADSNDEVNSQSVDSTQTTDAAPQSKVIGVSVGAVAGCIAAAGLAGMFIYRRREKTNHDQDVEDMNQTSEVNTRWRTQSFMAVVAGAVAKLPKRSNSSASNSGRASFNVIGSIRRAASNASRSLSVRSKDSTRSSVQSYGIAVSGPVPAIARIDADQSHYYGEPESPSTNHHTHAY